MFNLQNKVAVITGCGNDKGIGFAIAKAYAAEGVNLVIADICPLENIEALAEPLKKLGAPDVLCVRTDVSNENDVKNLVKKTIEKYEAIDILVNNAGIMRISTLLDSKVEDWDLLYSVMVRGTFLCTREVAKAMIDLGIKGKIINMSSIGGKRPWVYSAAYCACKSAIINFTQVAAIDLAAYGINVNGIAPGDHKTDMLDVCYKEGAKIDGVTVDEFKTNAIKAIPIRHLGTLEDISNMCLYLSSPMADFIVGQVMNVNGGSFMQ